jgi:heme o synthase
MSTSQISPARGFGPRFRAYLALTKPRVIELLLISTVPTMVLAAGEIPSLWLIGATLIGGALSAGSANAFNMYVDSDIDRLMGRTQGRPLVTGALSDRQALMFAWIIGVISVIWLGLVVNWLAAALSLSAILFYVFVYTLGLKRRTPQNIVWGGAAGAMPPLIGWAAVTESLNLTALVLFLIVFLWTPPHYWPLSMRYLDEYKAAKVPMLPVVAQNEHVGRQIILYTWAYLAATLLLIPVAEMGLVYMVTALVSGAWFAYEAHRLYRESKTEVPKNPMRLFHASITHLTLIFVVIAIDPLLPF